MVTVASTKRSQDLVTFRDLAEVLPATKIGTIFALLPQIEGLQRRGQKTRAIWQSLSADGLEISYDLFRPYLTRARRKYTVTLSARSPVAGFESAPAEDFSRPSGTSPESTPICRIRQDHGVARAMTAELHNDHSVFDEITSMLPAAQREHFYRRMAHLEHLGPDDKILQLAEALGFLALLTCQTPSEMAAERLKLESLFQNTLDILKAANHTALAYQADIDQRLKDLPGDILGAVNPKRLAVQLSETLRQHVQQTGIPAVFESLAQHAENLRQTSQQLSTTVATFADPERGTVTQLRRALDTMQANLYNAANHIRSLSHALVKDLHRALAVLCFGSLIVGFVLGLWLCRAVLAQTAN